MASRHHHTPTLLLILTTALLGACASTAPAPAEAPSYDGLTPVRGTNMQRVWVREGFDLSGYARVMFEDAGIHYRPVKKSDSAARAFPLSEEQRAGLEALIDEEFERAFQRLTLEVATEPAPDVLLVRGAILDVVSRVPPEGLAPDAYYLDSVGQATFVIEIRDSESNAVIIRAVDSRAAQTEGFRYQSNPVTNTAEARSLFAGWADLVVDALNEISSLDLGALAEAEE